MTLLNILLEPGRVRVATDSLIYERDRSVCLREDGSPIEVTKFAAIPHARMLIAQSGRMALLPVLLSEFLREMPRDLDQAIRAAPAIVRRVPQLLPVVHDVAGPYVGDRFHLVGWSEKLGRMAGVTFFTEDGFETYQAECLVTADLDASLQPVLPLERLGQFPSSDKELLALAHRQIADSGDRVFGGTLFVTEVTRDAVETRRVGWLGVPMQGHQQAHQEIASAVATLTPRVRVSWALPADGAVNAADGGTEVRFGLASWPESQWISVKAHGGATQADLVGVQQSQVYLFKARHFNALVNGNWSLPVLHVVGSRPPQLSTETLAPNAVAPIATAVQSGSTNVYLTEATIASATIDSKGYPIYVSFSVDCDGSYSGDKVTFRVKVDGSTAYTKDITATRDSSQPGAPWSVNGALVQTVIASPGTGTKTISVTAIGTHATYGVTVANGNLYCEGKLR